MTTIDCIVELIAGNTAPTEFSTVTSDEWENIAITAIVLGLAPLLHWQLEQHRQTLPSLTLAKLAVTRQAHAKRNQAIAHQLAEILAACNQQGISVIVLKGAVLAPLAYPDAALRPMNDIDLLFQPDELPQVAHLLEKLGYRGKYKDAAQGPGVTKHLSTYRRNGSDGSTPNPYLSADADRMVEPHGSLEEAWFGLKVDITPGVWQRVEPVLLHGQPCYRLSTADMLLHLAVHAAFHVIMGAAVFVQLYDIRRVGETWAAEPDWDETIKLARQSDAGPFVYAGFYWAKTLYQAPIPAEVLQALKAGCPAGLVNYIHSLDATRLLKRTQQAPLVTLKQRLQRGVKDRWETARWAGSLNEKWRVWQTALTFYKTDTASLLAGKKLKTEA